MMDFNKFMSALELAKRYSKGGETMCLTLSCMGGDFTYWLSGSNFPEDEYDNLDDVINQLKELNRPRQLFYQGEKCWTLFNDEVKEWFVESIYWDNELNDYRLSLSNKSYGKASFTQSMCHRTLADLFEAQAKKWIGKARELRHQHVLDAKKYYEGFGYKKTCTENQDSLTRDDCHVKETQECVHEDDGQAYTKSQHPISDFMDIVCDGKITEHYKCKKCGEFYR